MSDRTVTILNILAASSKLGEPPIGRTMLVKMTYLVELLRPSYELYNSAYKFVRYRHGPYSKNIFKSLDKLIFHGLVEAVEFRLVKGKVKATYKVTQAGLEMSDKISQDSKGRLLTTLCNDVIWGLQCLGIRDYKEIIRLVYNEPAYDQVNNVSIRKGVPDSDAVPLPNVHSTEHPSFRIQNIFSAIRRTRSATIPSPREVVRRYLQSLAVGAYSLTKIKA